MFNRLQKWITSHPYLFTSITFLTIIVFGWLRLYWRKEDFAFALLLFFIVTIGIRLDDISRKLGQIRDKNSQPSADNLIVTDQLLKIASTLKNIEKLLVLVVKKLDQKKPARRNPVKKKVDVSDRGN